jgi:D-3-phosphoglycerate dehydrogenase
LLPQVIKAAGPKLKVIGRAGAGTDNIDTVAATRAGVVVMNTPGGNTSAAAELTMSLMMAAARAIPQACAALKGGVWDRKTFANGVELKGKTVGVVGLGQIGSEVARRCQALDMKVVGFDPLVPEDRLAAAGVTKVTLEQLLAAADFITLHTPLNDATRGTIRRETLAKCKRGAFIINCARGGVVNEADLLEALNAGTIAGAAVDVFAEEPPKPGSVSAALAAHPRVVCTPHLGASTEEAQRKVAAEIAAQMSDAVVGRAYVGVVNATHLALASKPALEPFVRLAEALGR